jgi:cell division protein YceG involved in septum cleavage
MRLAEAGFGTEEAFRRCFQDASRIHDLDPAATDLEGYLFPDTYHFPVGETPERIAEALVRRFRQVAGAPFREEAARGGFTLRQAVTLASPSRGETSLSGARSRGVPQPPRRRYAPGCIPPCRTAAPGGGSLQTASARKLH